MKAFLMEKLTRPARTVDRLLETFLVALMATMVGNVLWQVFTRYVLGSPSSWTEELTRYLLIWLGLLGACTTFRRGQHLAVETLVERLGAEARRAASLASLAAVAAFSIAVLLVGGSNLVLVTLELEQRSAALGIPLGLVYLALPLTGTLLLFYVVVAAAELRSPGPEQGEAEATASRRPCETTE